ncbi:hypothetical protein ACJIZ3_012772 [Penstemon smallii]|uniref:RING-type domain-containing protein n=1 Tax=Penstemon smallii TaxID=265156 RepID=A0ABD3UPB0_9LAMI
MISMYAKSHLCTFTLIIYTYIWIPFLEITQSILRVLEYLWNPHQLPEIDCHFQGTPCQQDLPVSCFKDLDLSSKNGTMDNNEEEMCSICLMEFEKEDFVNKLPRCGHVFHMECMEKWLDTCKFTCPICRSSLMFNVPSGRPCNINTWASAFCIPPPALDS